ncbi:uncharacterized protein PFL1_01353 [Pseudozyma flocculosa PF-1]|uniref:NYN domain-containing protein n=1 Tax=Pseudozyma flocculosa TaxID=84751 RepID=A0A5C3EWB4_9BASI|nr:uncharacterized protein PFL1_01353 [Pseudozyma flocculosa PF-1]EPQ31165.1 hypothetical protein PFL1_01353 [Pseudozyma flocculosa PF-1]SPO36342.1 uncharacterized protein PSFLO_01813 [Pseudozyma flocculosa]
MSSTTLPGHNAALASLRALPAKLVQPPYRFLVLAGLGTASLLLAQRHTHSIWSIFASILGRLNDKSSSNINDNGNRKNDATDATSSSPPSQPARDPARPQKGRIADKYSVKEDADPVAIFWDVDNCSPPTGSSGRAVAQAIRSSMQNLELGPIVSFKAYLELSSETLAPNAQQVQLRSELQGSGVSLIDTPKSGRKDVADKMMITDLLAFAIDQPAPATIVLISGDRDFAYPLGLLRNRGYEIVLITPPVGAVPILEASANVVLTWRQDVLGMERASNGRPYASANGPGTPSKSSHAYHTKSTSYNNSDNAGAAVFLAAAAGGAASSSPPGNYASLSQGRPSSAPTRSTRRPSVQSTEVFQPLIGLLEQLRKEGNSKPLRAVVAARLIATDRGIFVRAGASRWAEYAAVAEAAGIIKLGTSGPPGTEWVSLSDQAPPASVPAHMRTLDAHTNASQSSPVPNRLKPQPSLPSMQPNGTPAPAGASPTAPIDIRAFYPLIEVCKEQKAQGHPRALCSYVGTQLNIMAKRGIVDAYAMAGVSSWREYIAAAERAGVARVAPSGTEGVYVVELHPKYLYSQTNQVTPSVNRMVDTATTPTPSFEKKTPSKKAAQLINSFNFAAKSSPAAKDVQPSGTTLFNGHTIAARFAGLAQVLLEQMSEGRNYSTDYFLHSVLGSTRAVNGIRLKEAGEFQAYLADAASDAIVMLEPGFKPTVKHVRLHPRLAAPGPAMMASASSADHLANGGDSSSSGMRREPSANGKAVRDPETAEKQKKAQDTLEQLSAEQKRAAESVRTSSGPVPANERLRFQILVDVLGELRSNEGLNKVPKARASSEVVKRNPGPGGMGVFYQALGSTGFTDYVDQARRAGFVVIVAGSEGDERQIDMHGDWQRDGDYCIRLASS